jgi:hypothetical protein
LLLVPACALIASRVTGSGWRSLAVAALIVAGAATTAATLWRWNVEGPRTEERLAAALRVALPDGGAVVTSGYWWLDLWYRLGAEDARFALIEVPAAAARHPGWYADGADRPARGEVEALAERLGGVERSAAVVVTPTLATQPTLERLALHLGLAMRMQVPGALLYLPLAPRRRSR